MAANPTVPPTPVTAIQQDDPSLGPAQLIADYEAGPELLRGSVAGMRQDELLARPVPGRWSTLEVLCHVCDSEQFFADRMKRTLALSRPLLVAADPQPYPEAVRYHDRDPAEELALAELTRRQVASCRDVATDRRPHRKRAGHAAATDPARHPSPEAPRPVHRGEAGDGQSSGNPWEMKMYVPTAFAETDKDKLHNFIEAYSFGLLVSTHGGEPFATHLPFLLDRNAGPHGKLVGHLARANPHWHNLEGQTVLAVFSGPHTYVSPTWYESENVVPTWNYVAVHSYGTCRLVDDPEALAGILTATVAAYERSMPSPWSIDTGSEFFQKMVRAVVGFRIEISRLEGKWKLNQNHPRERRQSVVRALASSEDRDAQEIARQMNEMLG